MSTVVTAKLQEQFDAGLETRADFTIDQPLERYGQVDHAVWKQLYARQSALLQGRACDAFVAGLAKIDLPADRVPSFADVNRQLKPATGWEIVAVPGLVPDRVFFEHLANRRFPVTWWMRRPDQLDYLQEPDCFHDLFGHVPLLIDPVFADYMQAYGRVALAVADDADALARVVAECARGLDFVGFYAGGSVARGFASSTGSRGWHEVENFDFNWSLYAPGGRAIKTAYVGDDWDDAVFARKVEAAAARLPVLGRAPKALAPGRYRTYFAPAAIYEMTYLIGWDGFSARAHQSARSALHKLHAGEVALDPRVSIAESLTLDIVPAFNADGYRRDSVPLVVAGRSAGRLVSARSAREYALAPNGANDDESPQSLTIAGGTLADDDALAALDTGLYVGNLWYLNFSDRMNCRMTGMTRFATFWVEGGKIVAPVDAMRFDDSFYRLFGPGLEQLGATPALQLNDAGWGERATGGAQVPGALVRGFELTL